MDGQVDGNGDGQGGRTGGRTSGGGTDAVAAYEELGLHQWVK